MITTTRGTVPQVTENIVTIDLGLIESTHLIEILKYAKSRDFEEGEFNIFERATMNTLIRELNKVIGE